MLDVRELLCQWSVTFALPSAESQRKLAFPFKNCWILKCSSEVSDVIDFSNNKSYPIFLAVFLLIS
jgi:hypothetical protein